MAENYMGGDGCMSRGGREKAMGKEKGKGQR